MTLYDQKVIIFQYFCGASLLLHAVQQKIASRATAHLAIEFIIRCSCKFLNIFF